MLSSGLRTQWSLTLRAPTRWYGMWQSAQATPARVDSLAPDLELRVLSLQDLVAGLGVDPVTEALRVVVGLDLLDAASVGPGVGHHIAPPLEVVLHVALPAHERAQLLPGRV